MLKRGQAQECNDWLCKIEHPEYVEGLHFLAPLRLSANRCTHVSGKIKDFEKHGKHPVRWWRKPPA